ncbi:hypothetical protein [Deinococcus ruber]|uniref:Uncharacterized protein n=1 Tax=Deinococcus ruber TaxID=1848197 RepID=A0A918CCN4_9DEIO|nr:hypothetical protein [Deinococcus ruber]GGR17452.1 hypothetical protein GCM10008957_32700 [Deinococcus ruber]
MALFQHDFHRRPQKSAFDGWLNIISHLNDLSSNPDAYFAYLRIIGNGIANNHVMESLADPHMEHMMADFWTDPPQLSTLFGQALAANKDSGILPASKCGFIPKPYRLRFGYDVIIPWMRRGKLIDILKEYSFEETPIKPRQMNAAHSGAMLLEPFGWVLLEDGNHTAETLSLLHLGGLNVSQRIDMAKLLSNSQIEVNKDIRVSSNHLLNLAISLPGIEQRGSITIAAATAWCAAQFAVERGRSWRDRERLAAAASLEPFGRAVPVPVRVPYVPKE